MWVALAIPAASTAALATPAPAANAAALATTAHIKANTHHEYRTGSPIGTAAMPATAPRGNNTIQTSHTSLNARSWQDTAAPPKTGNGQQHQQCQKDSRNNDAMELPGVPKALPQEAWPGFNIVTATAIVILMTLLVLLP